MPEKRVQTRGLVRSVFCAFCRKQGFSHAYSTRFHPINEAQNSKIQVYFGHFCFCPYGLIFGPLFQEPALGRYLSVKCRQAGGKTKSEPREPELLCYAKSASRQPAFVIVRKGCRQRKFRIFQRGMCLSDRRRPVGCHLCLQGERQVRGGDCAETDGARSGNSPAVFPYILHSGGWPQTDVFRIERMR